MVYLTQGYCNAGQFTQAVLWREMSRWGETVTHRYRLQGCQVGPVDDDDDD